MAEERETDPKIGLGYRARYARAVSRIYFAELKPQDLEQTRSQELVNAICHSLTNRLNHIIGARGVMLAIDTINNGETRIQTITDKEYLQFRNMPSNRIHRVQYIEREPGSIRVSISPSRIEADSLRLKVHLFRKITPLNEESDTNGKFTVITVSKSGFNVWLDYLRDSEESQNPWIINRKLLHRRKHITAA